jgi:hypothetical protein
MKNKDISSTMAPGSEVRTGVSDAHFQRVHLADKKQG